MMSEAEIEIQLRLSRLDVQILQILNRFNKDRDDLVYLLKKPRTTLYDHLNRLIMWGLIQKMKEYTTIRGRPRVIFIATEKGRKIKLPETSINEKRRNE